MTRHALLAAPVVALMTTTALVAGPATGSAEARSKPANPSGHYVGTEVPEEPNGLDDVIFNFDVKKRGRKITNFLIAMNVVCSGYPVYVEYVVQPMGPMKVDKRTGRFRDVVSGVTDGGTSYQVVVTGRLKGTRVTQGTLSYDVGICQRGSGDDGPILWKAKRTPRSAG